MKCIILAGGFATRLWPLTENKAKPLLHLKDRPLISHIVDRLPEEIEIIVSTNAVFEKEFLEWKKGYASRPIEIFVEDSASDDFKKGALGATAFVIGQKQINEDLMLIAGDNYFGFDLQKFISAYQGNPLLAAYDIKDLNQARKFGVVIKREGKVFGFQEKPENPASTLVSTGCYIFPAKNLADIVEYAKLKKDNLGGIFEYLLTKGETIDAFVFDDPWYDIGSFDAYLKANNDLIGDHVIKGEGVEEAGKNKFEGSVFIGGKTTVKDSLLHNTIILSNCVIENCVLRDCVVDEDCRLTNLDLSHKMVRAGSRIGK